MGVSEREKINKERQAFLSGVQRLHELSQFAKNFTKTSKPRERRQTHIMSITKSKKTRAIHHGEL